MFCLLFEKHLLDQKPDGQKPVVEGPHFRYDEDYDQVFPALNKYKGRMEDWPWTEMMVYLLFIGNHENTGLSQNECLLGQEDIKRTSIKYLEKIQKPV